MSMLQPTSPPSAAPSRPCAPKHKLRFKLLALAMSLALVFAALEVGLRLIGAQRKTVAGLATFFEHHPIRGWAGVPNTTMTFATQAFRCQTSHGADGFRTTPLWDIAVRFSGVRPDIVWVQGDSGTWGWGVDDGKTYVDQLNSAKQTEFAFRNVGACGYSSVQEYLQLRDLLEHGEKPPRHVLLLFCNNDLHENMDSVDQDPPRAYCLIENGQVVLRGLPVPRPRGLNLHAWFVHHSLAYNHLHFSYVTLRKAMASHWKRRRGPAGEYTDEQFRVLKHVYGLERDLCRQHGIAFRPVFLGRWSPENSPEATQRLESLRSRFLQVCRELDLEAIDLTEATREHFRSGGGKLSFEADPHFNALGHEVIARAIGRQFFERYGRFSPVEVKPAAAATQP